jgi:hypothetical protein
MPNDDQRGRGAGCARWLIRRRVWRERFDALAAVGCGFVLVSLIAAILLAMAAYSSGRTNPVQLTSLDRLFAKLFALGMALWLVGGILSKISAFLYRRALLSSLDRPQTVLIESLIDTIERKAIKKYAAAVSVLGDLGNRDAVPAIIPILRDPNYRTRKRAAESLGQLGGKEAVAQLASALGDDNGDVRRTVACSLDRLGWVPATDGERASYLVAKQRWSDLRELGEAAIDASLVALNDQSDKGGRKAAVAVLSSIGNARATDALLEASRDKDNAVRQSAQRALEQIETPAAEIEAMTPESAGKSRKRCPCCGSSKLTEPMTKGFPRRAQKCDVCGAIWSSPKSRIAAVSSLIASVVLGPLVVTLLVSGYREKCFPVASLIGGVLLAILFFVVMGYRSFEVLRGRSGKFELHKSGSHVRSGMSGESS